ncbi:calcineurin B homologous protein 2-like, partial [Sphaerodactylus townsendi]|uniref:calcineurin B homologous protein 2-like n=1 Tax=Sphaerodactylus townsendi TaxID=933632 RepID=UPI0020267A0E
MARIWDQGRTAQGDIWGQMFPDGTHLVMWGPENCPPHPSSFPLGPACLVLSRKGRASPIADSALVRPSQPPLDQPPLGQPRCCPILSQANVMRLYQRFQALDKDGKGYLSKDDFQGIRELAVNPIGDRIINSFFQDGRKMTDFRTFVHVLAHFRPVERTGGSENINSRLNKLKFAFQLYDQDKDGKISRAELLQVITVCVQIKEKASGKWAQ